MLACVEDGNQEKTSKLNIIEKCAINTFNREKVLAVQLGTTILSKHCVGTQFQTYYTIFQAIMVRKQGTLQAEEVP